MNVSAEENPAETSMSFWDHLAELRKRLLICIISLVGGFLVAWIFKERLFSLVSAPVKEGLAQHGIYRLTAIETVEAIVVYLKLSVGAAIVVSVPVALWQLWLFVRPGLEAREIRPMRRIAVLAFFMFWLGLIFSYQFVLPLVIDFLTGFTLGAGDVDFQVTMKSAYSTTLIFLVGFGVIFELPLVMVLLAATPLVDARRYLKWIRYAVVLSFVVGSMLTPPDILSQSLMAVPVTVLYCIGIGMTYLMERRRARNLPAPKGFDWGLSLASLSLTGVIVLLVLPAPVPMSAYLPYGAGTVSLGRNLDVVPTCGLSPNDIRTVDESITQWVCANYTEGTLLLLSGSSAQDDCCPRMTTRGRGKCVTVDETVVYGAPLLVTRYVHNQDVGRQDSDPLLVTDETRFTQFVSLLSTRKQQRSYLRFSVTGDSQPQTCRLDLAFTDPEEAASFVAALADDQSFQLKSTPVSQQSDAALRDAIEELAVAVELLAARSDDPLTADIENHLQRARNLTGKDELSRKTTPFGSCTTAPCAYARLSTMLPESDEVSHRGRVVTLTYSDPDGTVAQKVTAFLLE